MEELTSFVKQIACQYETGWGEKLEYHDIKAKNSDVVSIRLYHDNIKFFTGEAFEKQVKSNQAGIQKFTETVGPGIPLL